MAVVTLTAGEVGSDIVLAADTLFHVRDGNVELSTDAGTTYIPFGPGERFLISSGLTVKPKNSHSRTATLAHMSF